MIKIGDLVKLRHGSLWAPGLPEKRGIGIVIKTMGLEAKIYWFNKSIFSQPYRLCDLEKIS